MNGEPSPASRQGRTLINEQKLAEAGPRAVAVASAARRAVAATRSSPRAGAAERPRATLLGSMHTAQRILLVRGQKVLVDADLAELYGVSTKRLNQQTRRNAARFPPDFVFELTPREKAGVVANCNHLARLRFSPALPLAFTEHGALMAASVLNTPRAVEMSLYVVRAFVRLREALATHKALARKLEELERAVATLDAKTDTRFRETFDAIRALMAQPEPKRRPIGFITPEEKKQRG